VSDGFSVWGLSAPLVGCSIDGVDPKPKEGSALDLSGSRILVTMQVRYNSRINDSHWYKYYLQYGPRSIYT
jgi:hypothetical protein